MKKDSKKNAFFFALGFFLIVALGVSGSLAFFYHPSTTPPSTPTNEPTPFQSLAEDGTWRHPLTGMIISVFASSTPMALPTTIRPFAVMIDNAPEARPSYGLSRADIVYHTLVEGGITRFLALFSATQAERIGPVRSARPYFISQAQDWNAIYVHSGGSAAALSILQQNPPRISDLNEFSNGTYFTRTQSPVPHNLFTSTAQLMYAAKNREYSLALTALPTWGYSNEPYPDTPTAQSLSISYQIESMRVTYQYNATTNSYYRTQGLNAQYDGSDHTRISPANVILEFKNLTDIPDPQKFGLIDFADNGSGQILVFSKGQVLNGRWSRSGDGPTVYSTVTGRTLLLTPGQTFIEVLPSEFKGKVQFE